MMPKHVWHELMILAQVFCTFKMLATLHVNALYQNIHIFWHSVFFEKLIFSKGLSRFDVVGARHAILTILCRVSTQDASLGWTSSSLLKLLNRGVSRKQKGLRINKKPVKGARFYERREQNKILSLTSSAPASLKSVWQIFPERFNSPNG